MKVSQIDVSPSAYQLINDFNEWLENSSKKTYRFTTEEQYALEELIKQMNNQIDMLVDYETKRKNENKEV